MRRKHASPLVSTIFFALISSLAFNLPMVKAHVDTVGSSPAVCQTTLTVEEVPDVAVTDINPSKTVVGKGHILPVYVTVENQSNSTETFNVTAYADMIIIDQTTTTLTNNNSTTLTFTWNTTNFDVGNYTISAHAHAVPSETDTADNNLTDGWVIVSVVGDITGPDGWPDCEVDMRDISLTASKFGVNYPDPRYYPNCDINGDRKIDIWDIGQIIISARSQVGKRIDVWFVNPPNGGQGIHEPADLVLPQTELTLTAKVTYNWWPVQHKNVTFEIRDNNGTLWKSFQDDTDDEGHAYVTFRMPWPCQGAEDLLGKWNVTVSATLEDVVITDYVIFDYDYLIHIWKITTDKLEYKHYEDVEITVEYGTHAMREENVVLAVTVTDGLGVPIGVVLVELTVGEAGFCTYKNYTTVVTIYIDKFAYAGLATVHASFLNGLPSEGGEAVAQEVTTTFYILPC